MDLPYATEAKSEGFEGHTGFNKDSKLWFPHVDKSLTNPFLRSTSAQPNLTPISSAGRSWLDSDVTDVGSGDTTGPFQSQRDLFSDGTFSQSPNHASHEERSTTFRGTEFLGHVQKHIRVIRGSINPRAVILTWSMASFLALVVLLCIFIVQKQTEKSAYLDQDDLIYFEQDLIQIAIADEEKTGARRVLKRKLSHIRDWYHVQKLCENLTQIHFVGKKESESQGESIGQLTAHVENGSLKIYGRPSFCDKNAEHNIPVLHFGNISHLHLSHMENCPNYANVILSGWEFPRVHGLRLHKVSIAEKEFDALSNFIDNYNETLHSVEIDECFLCHGSRCDPGMINFPNHNFRLSITRRRESPGWI